MITVRELEATFSIATSNEEFYIDIETEASPFTFDIPEYTSNC